MKNNKNKFAFNGMHLRNIKIKFEEKTGLQLENKRANETQKRVNPKTIIASIVIVAILLMSANFAMIAQRVFDADGKSFLQYIPFRKRNPPPEGEELERLEWQNEFFAFETAENIFAIITFGDGSIQFNLPQRIIYDYEEFIKYTDDEIFAIPKYIPDGYKFTNAYVRFFLDKDFDTNNTEHIYREEKFGNIYDKYYITENIENIENIMISYAKEENGEKMWLWYYIRLEHADYIKTQISGNENTIGEVLDMPQFDRNLLQSTDDYIKGEISSTQRTFWAFNTIPTKYGYADHRISRGEYGVVAYQIDTHFLTREEIIKMAQSIK